MQWSNDMLAKFFDAYIETLMRNELLIAILNMSIAVA